MLSSAPDKAELFDKNLSENANLDDSGISSPIFGLPFYGGSYNITIVCQSVCRAYSRNLQHKASHNFHKKGNI